MIFLLFVLLLIVSFSTYKWSTLGVLSPGFIASTMFLLMTFVYVVTFSEMKSDISLLTVIIIILFIVVTIMGEYVGTYFRLNSSIKRRVIKAYNVSGIVEVNKTGIVGLTIIYLVVDIIRFYNLKEYALIYAGKESFSSITEMMTNARYAYVKANGTLELSGTIANQFVYMSEITTYICLFVFIYNLVKNNHKSWYVLLPLIPDLFNRLITTSRTSFIILFGACIISYLISKESYKNINFNKMIIPIVVAIVLFLLYGRLRNNAQSIPLVSYLQMYTCSSIYGLDSIVKEGLKTPPYFGYNTMQQIYRIFGLHNGDQIAWGQNMLTFSKSGYHANLYTSLSNTLKDYGYIGTLFVRFFTAIISTKLLKSINVKNGFDRKLLVYYYFIVSVAYCYFYSATGDVFKDIFLNPYVMIRYFLYAIILVYIILEPKGKTFLEE